MYVCVNLKDGFRFHFSGRSENAKPLKHLSRTLKDYELFVGLSGTLHIAEDSDRDVKAGDVLLHKKGSFQRGTKAAPCDFFWLHFDGEVLTSEDPSDFKDKKGKGWVVFPDYFSLKNSETVTVMLTEINHFSLLSDGQDVATALSSALLCELERQSNTFASSILKNKRFNEVLGYVDLHFAESLRAFQIAELFGYNAKYFSRLFKRETGKNVSEYLNEKRIEKAKELLDSDNSSVKTVAITCGFTDEYYFMRVFKKKTGLTPSEYRKTFSSCLYT